MDKQTISDLTERVDRYILASLVPPRYKHSVRVARMAEGLCGRFGLPRELGFFTGLAHDMCKGGKDRWLLNLAEQDGEPVSRIESEKPALLHGRAAAVLLAQEFTVDDPEVLDAIRHHTFGSPSLGPLGQILFVADKMEPGRTAVPADFRKQVLSAGLEEMTLLVLRDNLEYLRGKHKLISGNTVRMLEALEKRGITSQ